jgi:cobalt-zinc-cadmium efflux system membrane fusion protein
MLTVIPNGNGPVAAAPRSRQWLLRLLRAVPTALVLAALGSIAYYGHETGWSFSKGGSDKSRVTDYPDMTRPKVRLSSIGSSVARIEFDSIAAVERTGIDIAPVWASALTERVAAAGEVGFDPTRLARVSARAHGVARRVVKAVGDPVRLGEVLAFIESSEVGKSKAELQRALVQARYREQVRDDLIGAKSATSPAALREAEAAVKETGVRVIAATQSLTNLGLTVNADDLRRLAPAEVANKLRALGTENESELTANLLPVRAPFAGVLLSADLVAGEIVEAGKPLFVVVDASRVWITLHVTQQETRRVEVGQEVYFRPDGASRDQTATVVWIGASADETTRTVPVRAVADNATGSLRASTLGRGRIVLRQVPKAIVVPRGAVKRFRDKSIVFVRDPDFLTTAGPKAFEVREVGVGGQDDWNDEILSGVSSGEIVATKGSDLLLQELLRADTGR